MLEREPGSYWREKAVAVVTLLRILARTGSEALCFFICLDAIKFSLLSFFSLLKTIYPRVLTKQMPTLPNDAKSALPVDVRRSKTLLLKLPNIEVGKTSYQMLEVLSFLRSGERVTSFT